MMHVGADDKRIPCAGRRLTDQRALPYDWIMLDVFVTAWLHWLGRTPCFRVYGKGKRERAWREISVYATPRRNAHSRWPLWRGTCVTWGADVISIGSDFAAEVLREQAERP